MRHAFDEPLLVGDSVSARRGAAIGRKRPVQQSHALILSPVEWLVVIGVVAVTIALLLPLLARHSTCRRPPTTWRNLQWIGQVSIAYAMENGEGRFPDSFEDLVSAKPDMFGPHDFIAPPGKETPAETFEQMFSEPGHISFVWAGRGLTMDNIAPDTVLVYQARSTRPDGEVWVAYADGSTRRLTPAELQERLRASADLLMNAELSEETAGCVLVAPPAAQATPNELKH